MLNMSIRRYYTGSSMFFSPHLIEQWRLFDHSSDAHDLANAHAIIIQSAVRSKLARNRLKALKYTSRCIKTFEYMNRRIVIRKFVEQSISTGMNLIFHRAIEQIVEELLRELHHVCRCSPQPSRPTAQDMLPGKFLTTLSSVCTAVCTDHQSVLVPRDIWLIL